MKLKTIATAVGGIGYGALLGWALTADYYDQRLKEKEDYIEVLRRRSNRVVSIAHNATPVEEEPHLVGELNDISHPTLFEDDDEDSEPEKPRGNETGEATEADGDEEVDEDQTEAVRSELQGIIDQYVAKPEDRDEFVNKATTSVGSNEQPFVIDQATYAWDEEGENHQKTTVTYYPSSRVVLDEDDEVIDDPGNVIGWRNLSRFGDESGDADVVFIRNRRLMTDFEVVKDEDSPLPLHVKYGLGLEEFNTAKAAGTLRLRDEDV
jgi:hypothetical protein